MTLDELKKLCEAATPGPWFDIKGAGYRGVFTVPEYSQANRLEQRVCDVYHRNAESAAFIAALRNAAPALIAIAVIADNFCSGELAPSGNARRYQNELSQALAALTLESP